MERERVKEEPDNLPQFWKHIYGGQQGFIALFSGRRSAKSLLEPLSAYFPYPHASDRAVDWITVQQTQSREIYNAAHLVSTHLRRKETALPLHALYVDLDDGALTPEVPPPTLVVESSPRRLQCYWKLERIVQPRFGERLNRRLALALGGDNSGWDLTQLLRVPGTVNYKYPETPVVRVISQTQSAYDPERLDRLLPTVPTSTSRKPRISTATPTDALDGVELEEDDQHILEGLTVKLREDGNVDRSASLLLIARVLYDAGLRGDTILARLVERDVALGWNKYARRRDAHRRYQDIVALVSG
jgi:RepB DNA-primase from phage plasmid